MNWETERNVSDYERSADDTRRRLSSTLDELAASLTPGRMLDEVLSYARAGGGDFLKGLGKAASANPVPTLLIGVGAAMFLSGKGRVGNPANGSARRQQRGPEVLRAGTMGESELAGEASTSTIKSAGKAIGDSLASVGSGIAGKVNAAASGLRGGVAAAGATVSRTAAGIANEAVSTLSNAGKVAQNAGTAVGKAAGDVADSVSGYAASTRDALVDRGERAFDQSSRLLNDLRGRGSDLAHEQPLIVAAVGLALGAAAAALLPRSQTEDSLMGDASDAIKGAVGEAAGEQYRQAKTAAEKVVEEARTTAVSQGLSPAGAADAVRALGDKLVSVAAGAATAAKPTGGT